MLSTAPISRPPAERPSMHSVAGLVYLFCADHGRGWVCGGERGWVGLVCPNRGPGGSEDEMGLVLLHRAYQGEWLGGLGLRDCRVAPCALPASAPPVARGAARFPGCFRAPRRRIRRPGAPAHVYEMLSAGAEVLKCVLLLQVLAVLRWTEECVVSSQKRSSRQKRRAPRLTAAASARAADGTRPGGRRRAMAGRAAVAAWRAVSRRSLAHNSGEKAAGSRAAAHLVPQPAHVAAASDWREGGAWTGQGRVALRTRERWRALGPHRPALAPAPQRAVHVGVRVGRGGLGRGGARRSVRGGAGRGGAPRAAYCARWPPPSRGPARTAA